MVMLSLARLMLDDSVRSSSQEPEAAEATMKMLFDLRQVYLRLRAREGAHPAFAKTWDYHRVCD